ncbi:Ktr system potassium uptake protein A [bacterium HR07]|uniref:Trk system potassium uptake protein TrkA n=2 Tax=Candidatus Bipolaricaulota TaxID=67810 RepID=H5S8Z1_9BACT|nr:trk system potassium uptake protein TrkA [uncultured Acetothermia bacterium]BAL52627.1 trk system potassium uptake protein TrkA [uncultured Acetothermia bacterium]BAL59614.1 trk system potassium uptake protein TrkA [Candidatus Acetothermum autotrophicum]GBC76359.1 Ktr system potassium uptake protein A [bacterium HR07]
MQKRIFAVLGLGNFGFHVAKTLSQAGYEVLALDRDSEKVQTASEFVTYALQCDSMDLAALREAGVHNADVAVVSMGDDIEASVLTVMNLKELGVREIIAKANSEIHGKVLSNLGVRRVVHPEQESAIRLAHSLITPNLLEYLELVPGYSVVEIPAPSRLVGKTLLESQLRTRYRVNVIAIKKDNTVNLNPAPQDRLEAGDILVIIGKEEDIQHLSSLP